MITTPEQLKLDLPPRDFWFSKEIAGVLGVDVRTIQYCAKRKGVGKKVKNGPRGTYIFLEHDLPKICEYVKGVVGNPNWGRKDDIVQSAD